MENVNTIGVMLDCSRNAVMSLAGLKRFVDVLAKMGYNRLMLYTEDTYEVEGEPFFGYMRGRYTKKELKEIDTYALSKGIELVPCIQTLAHLNQIFEWETYQKIKDVNDILLVDEERTYQLIDNMLKACVESFTTKNVHIGMDEAHLLGLGKYLDKHGYTNRHELLLKHLNKVCEMAVGYGLKPMIWSDMFFRLAFGNYYVSQGEVPQEVIEKVPKCVELVYWDYYSQTQEFYESMIEKHLAFDNPVSFAGGCWKWGSLQPRNKRSIIRSELALRACNKHGVKDVITTLWGDDGNECPVYATLPALFYFAEAAKGNYDLAAIKEKFYQLFDEHFDDFMQLDFIFPESFDKDFYDYNGLKALFYNDPFVGRYDSSVRGDGTEGKQYALFAEQMKQAKTRSKNYAYIFEHYQNICDFMSIKYDLGYRAREAYQKGRKDDLKIIVKDFKKAEKKLQTVCTSFEKMWMMDNKAFGYEVIELWLGGLLKRLESCRKRIQAYLQGKNGQIEELEVELLDCYGQEKIRKILPDCGSRNKAATVNRLVW